MPRGKKNPITELPVTEVDPFVDQPEVFEPESRPQSNVVPISNDVETVQSERDWSGVDRVLSDVVNFV